jgi:hypothetical protein
VEFPRTACCPPTPGIITGIHQTLADIAFFPCPDPEPEIIPAAPPETQNPELTTPDTCPDPSPKPDADVEDDVGHDEAEAKTDATDREDDAARDVADSESIPETTNSELRTQNCFQTRNCFPSSSSFSPDYL